MSEKRQDDKPENDKPKDDKFDRHPEGLQAFLIFSGSGPILVLTTYGDLDEPELLEKLRNKGIDKFLAYKVELSAVRERYLETFEKVCAELGRFDDIRVLDFNGHQIMARLSLAELGQATQHGG